MIRKILCAMDFSEPSEAAWRLGLNIARQCEAEVVLLHVLPALATEDEHLVGRARDSMTGRLARDRPRLWNVFELHEELSGLDEGTPGVARRRLSGLASAAGPWGVPIATRVRRGAPHQEIDAVAGEEGADLIVIGTHGRTGLGRLVLGSVAEQVARTAPCPVLVVRHQALSAKTP